MAKRTHPSTTHVVENCLGCKWTLLVLARIRAGVSRPGRLEKSIPGITTKVLSERLAKLVRFALVARTAYPEIPPRVEYRLTPFGRRLCRILDAVDRLQEDRAAGRMR